MTTKPTVQSFAIVARSYFVQHERSEGDTIWTLHDDRPEWVRDLCHAAHDAGGMLPDDWRYQFIVEALDAIEGHDDEGEARDSIEADAYTSDLCRWLASRADRTGYVDDACEEWGDDAPAGIVDRIMMGQFMEKREVFDSVLASLSSMAEDADEDDDSDDA
jgi:hypothetical protein